ncbi:MAG: ABC transporter permease subunit [Steroidobacteraceae bacterium]
MAAVGLPMPPAGRSARWMRIFWSGALVTGFAFAFLPAARPPAWMLELPLEYRVPAQAWISAAMKWLMESADFGLFTFREATRFIAYLLEQPLSLAIAVLARGFTQGHGSSAVELVPPLPWLAVLIGACAIAWHAGGRRLAMLAAGGVGYLVVFGQWQSAMLTLGAIVIAVPFGVASGLLLGIAAHRSARFHRALTPILDAMQAVPIFAYLLPILFLFGFGPVAALLATIIFAMPPMARVTLLAFSGVSAELVEAGRMAGCTPRQLITRVMIPAARAPLMTGVNQVIMLSLNMVIIASMIGAGGLGYDVLAALRQLDIGGGLEAGTAIVVLAIILDRVSQAYAKRALEVRRRTARGIGAIGRWLGMSARPKLAPAVIAVVVALWLAAFWIEPLRHYPEAWVLSTGEFWDDLVAWLNVNYFDTFEAIKTAILLNFMIPVKRFLLVQPWPFIAFCLTVAALSIAGARRSITTALFVLAIAITGLWQPAMVSVYLTGVSVLLAVAMGIPIGIASGTRPRVWQVVEVVIDTLQTLPSLVYLIPVVMLFRVGDFTAMIAIILYALAPAIRYTALGIREVNPVLIEAAVAMGATRRQLLLRVRLPLALPSILLGINQTIMLALSMLVITALVGTRDLGQEVYIALVKADVGRGLMAGIGVAMIAMIADRLMTAAAARMKRRLGLA